MTKHDKDFPGYWTWQMTETSLISHSRKNKIVFGNYISTRFDPILVKDSYMDSCVYIHKIIIIHSLFQVISFFSEKKKKKKKKTRRPGMFHLSSVIKNSPRKTWVNLWDYITFSSHLAHIFEWKNI